MTSSDFPTFYQDHGPIGMGTMGMGGYFKRDDTDDVSAIAAVRTGIDAGLTWIDTSEVYGAGHAEELVGEAVQGRRDSVYLSSKVAPEHLAPKDLRIALERTLKRMQVDQLDLYYVHWPNPLIPIEDTMGAMTEAKDAGLIRHIGLSNFSLPEMQAAQAALGDHRIDVLQSEYNLFDRTVADEVLPYCRENGIVFAAYSPLDVGRLADTEGEIRALADEAGITPAQLALAWVTRTPGIVAIPKAATPAQIAANAAVRDLDVDAAILDRLGACCAVPVTDIDPDTVQVDRNGLDGFVPGPDALSATLRDGVPLKPIRVTPGPQNADFDYTLVEGKLRYWAWRTAFPERKTIPALIRN